MTFIVFSFNPERQWPCLRLIVAAIFFGGVVVQIWRVDLDELLAHGVIGPIQDVDERLWASWTSSPPAAPRGLGAFANFVRTLLNHSVLHHVCLGDHAIRQHLRHSAGIALDLLKML